LKGREFTMRKAMLFAASMAAIATVLATPLGAASRFPEKIALPNGFRPEGIAIGKRATFYVGSIPTGAIYRGDLRTGQGSIFIPGAAGRAAIGLELDRGRLFVAGGPTGSGFVYSVRTGSLLASQRFTTGASFVNDVVDARGGAYFTDSSRPFIYRLSLGDDDEAPSFTAIALSGDYVHQPPPAFNLNGIDATRDGRTLIAVQSSTGKLFTIDPRSGGTREIVLNQPVANGDGILLDGRILYVVQNRDNKVAVVRLDRNLRSGTVVTHITDPDFDVPTTIDDFGDKLYAVNARFTTAPTPDTPYWLAKFRKFDHGDDDHDDDGDDDHEEDDDD
jgi:sugar lactone lactonase YvrE